MNAIKIKTLIGTALVATMWTSCSNEENLPGDSNYPDDNVIRVTANVDDARTRSLTTETLDSFYVSIHNKDTSTYSYGYEPFKKVNGEWVSDNLLLWQNEEQPVDIIAVCNAGIEPNADINLYNDAATQIINEDQNEKSTFDKQDLLIYEFRDFVPKNNLVNKKLNIPFRHALSLIYIRIILGTEYNVPYIPAETPIDSIKITGTYNWATVDFRQSPVAIKLETEPLLDDFTKYDIKPYHEQFNEPATKNDHSEDLYACILLPQTIKTGEFQVKLSAEESIYVWTSSADFTLESGKKYELTLTMGKDVVTAGTITSQEWNDRTGGDLETE